MSYDIKQGYKVCFKSAMSMVARSTLYAFGCDARKGSYVTEYPERTWIYAHWGPFLLFGNNDLATRWASGLQPNVEVFYVNYVPLTPRTNRILPLWNGAFFPDSVRKFWSNPRSNYHISVTGVPNTVYAAAIHLGIVPDSKPDEAQIDYAMKLFDLSYADKEIGGVS